jgi:hypothetical protein
VLREYSPVSLYGCDTWSLTLREVYRLKVFGYGVLEGTFGLKRNEKVGGWRKLDKIRMIKSRSITWAGHVA